MFEQHLNFGTDGCFVDSWERIPLCVRTDVPQEKNYLLTVTLRAEEDEPELMVFAGRRHLAYSGTLAAGESLCREISVNVCGTIPRPSDNGSFGAGVELRVVGRRIRLTALDIREAVLPTVYIAGDSTVASQGGGIPYDPSSTYCGWGQMLGAYLNYTMAVCNQAHCGLDTESFRTEGHFDIVMRNIRAGDFFLIQFGHNDQKQVHLQARAGYCANLFQYIQEVRDKGAYPILVTPLARNTWAHGICMDSLGDYAVVCKELGQALDVPVLDLHGLSLAWLKCVGQEAASAYRYPDDATHPNDYGAYLAADFIRNELHRTCSGLPGYQSLADAVTSGFGPWTPEKGQKNETPL